MLRFILVVLANVKRGPYLIPKMRKMFHHPERYSEQVRYAFAQKLINYMKSSGKIKTEVYGTENYNPYCIILALVVGIHHITARASMMH